MSSMLQLDMRNLSLGRRRLVNAYEVKAGIGVITGNTVWSMPECLECEVLQQELSYRKQIARQLRTQFVEGIYDNPMTLKSRLTVTQGHWKRNHWVDHTRLTIRRVIGRWILSWPWNVGQKSLKVIEISVQKLGCGFLFAFSSNYIQCQRMAWPWKPG